MRCKNLAILAIILSTLASTPKTKATLIHDIEATQGYSNEHGIRLQDSQDNLLEGIMPVFDKYSGDLNVKFKLKNVGDFTEETTPQGFISNTTNPSAYSWSHNHTTLTPGQYKYRERNVDLSKLENGIHTIRVGAELDGDTNPNNNYRERNINLVPEPSTLAFLAAAAIALSKRRRK